VRGREREKGRKGGGEEKNSNLQQLLKIEIIFKLKCY
jgi:hypothetical protein